MLWKLLKEAQYFEDTICKCEILAAYIEGYDFFEKKISFPNCPKAKVRCLGPVTGHF